MHTLASIGVGPLDSFLSHGIQLSFARQICSTRISPDLVFDHLPVLVKGKHVGEDLVPALTSTRPGESCFSSDRHSVLCCIDDVRAELHVLVAEVGCQGLEVLFHARVAGVLSAQEGCKRFQAVFVSEDVVGGGEVSEDVVEGLLAGEGIAEGFGGGQEGCALVVRHGRGCRQGGMLS